MQRPEDSVMPMPTPWTHGNRLVGFDRERRRLWVGGQRLHHGLTGAGLAGAGLAQLMIRRSASARLLASLLAGGALMAHDWKDRGVWFRRGPQT
jgi:hypothetical protein